MNTQIILTLDYEVFGSGKGDVKRDIIEPTNRILDICDRHFARMTIMFEVAEYWAFREYDKQLSRDLGYSPADEIQRQIIRSVSRDHDVQLHLHPQWIDAGYRDGVWHFNQDSWRLADLPGGPGNTDNIKSITGALYAGKKTLEDILEPVKPDYQCICFRAGGFYAQPSADVITAMKNVGLQIDSSVVPGYHTHTPYTVDFTTAPTDMGYWWTTADEITEQGATGRHIIELPVSTVIQPYWKNFKPTKLLTTIKRRKTESSDRQVHKTGSAASSTPSLVTVAGKFFSKHAHTFDFCKLSARDMLERADKCRENSIEPVTVIGHSKDFFNDHNFDSFLADINSRHQYAFTTISGFAQRVFSEA